MVVARNYKGGRNRISTVRAVLQHQFRLRHATHLQREAIQKRRTKSSVSMLNTIQQTLAAIAIDQCVITCTRSRGPRNIQFQPIYVYTFSFYPLWNTLPSPVAEAPTLEYSMTAISQINPFLKVPFLTNTFTLLH